MKSLLNVSKCITYGFAKFWTVVLLLGLSFTSNKVVAQISPTTGTTTNTVGNTTTITINGTASNYVFTVPAGVTQVTVQAWGGGGGTRTGTDRRGGGGGGAFARSILNVTANETYNVTIGAGGTAADPGNPGGNSVFGPIATPLVRAAGGSGGSNTGGVGGTIANSIGTTRFAGGSGGDRGTNSGGGGGGSATLTANGNNGAPGSGNTGGIGGTGTGNGGNGGNNNLAGANGVVPGGGGGGSGNGNGTAGLGASGRIVLTYTVCSPAIGIPVFSLGASSTRCQGAATVTYTATSSSSTGITYSLNPESVTAGNTINTSNGAVTYAANYVGTTTITATAVGCLGPQVATHTVTVNPTISLPVFNLGATSQRCSAAGNVSYAATSTNSTGISYTLDATSLGAGNSINANNGVVTYVASWAGISTITATAAGCGGPRVSTHQASSARIFANNDAFVVNQGVPLSFNVLSNDLCNINPNSLTIVNQPVGGFVQVGTGGQLTYVSFGAFVGTDQFNYEICSNAPVVCRQATVSILVEEVQDDPCFEANKEKVYFLPFPENNTQLRQSLLSAASANNLTANARNITSIAVAYPRTVIIYDHWEDGYETEITNPQQSTTQVWGDGDLTNGVAPGYPTDLIPPGGSITLDNTFPWDRPASTIVFDGKDKIYSTSSISVSKVTGDGGLSGSTILFDVQNVKTNVSDVSRFGQFFLLPLGENITAGPTTAFRYTGLFARAAENGTIVQLDYNGDGIIDTTSPTLNQGEVWFYNGTGSTPGVVGNVNQANDLKAGARVISNKVVGIDLVFGGIDTYGTRNIPLLPSQFYGSTYYSPVYSTNTDAPAIAYFVNPDNVPITINWSRSAGAPLSGSFVVPANNGLAFFNMNVATGTKFQSANNSSFTAVVVIDADNTGSTYDWAFNMIPENRLTSMAGIAWAPGSSNGTANYNPIWVTPSANTTVYVRYNGNLTSGPLTSPCGAAYDVSFNVNALQSQLIFGLNNDNSGIAVFNCNDIPMSAVWGQRPFGTTPAASPAIDVGYTMAPKCLAKIIFATPDSRITPQNTPITINVAANDAGYLVAIDPLSVSILNQPNNGTVVRNPDGSITYTPNVGFSGEDVFEYQICAQTPDDFICDRTRVFVRVPCQFQLDNSVIAGSVYGDFNADGRVNTGELGLGLISVQLYNDVNGNQVLDPGEPLLQTQNTTNGINRGYFQFNVPQATFRDEFSTNGSATGSNGTQSWVANPWIKVTEGGTFSQNQIQVIGNRLRITGNAATTQIGARRTANLTGATGATLSYTFDKSAFSINTTDWVDVQVASSATGPWTTLVRYSGTAAATGTASFNITPWISANTTIRMVESTDAGFITSEQVFFDNVQISYVSNRNFILKLASPVTNNWYQTSFPASYAINFTNPNDSKCENTFGLYLLANPDNNATFVNQSISGDVSTNDKIPVGTTYGTTPILNSAPLGSSPNLVLNVNGTYTFISDLAGDYVYSVQICAPNETGGCANQLLTITVTDPVIVNNQPTTNKDIVSALENTPVVLNTLGNDKAGNTGGTLNPASVVIVQGTEPDASNQGTLSVNPLNGDITFTPVPNFSGIVTYQYEVCDNDTPTANCGRSFQEVTILPLGSNNSVLAADDYNRTVGTIPATGNVLDNDTDPEGDKLSAIAQNLNIPSVGTFVLNTNGTYTFIAVNGFSGPVNFVYEVCDVGIPVACAKATLYILVEEGTAIQPDINATFINLPVLGNVSTNDRVPAGTKYGNTLNLVSSPLGSNPSLDLEIDGSYSFWSDLPGQYIYSIEVCGPDEISPCPTETLKITVTDPYAGVNVPIVNTDITSTLRNNPVIVRTLANDAAGNVGGTLNPASVKIVPGTAPNAVTQGTLSINAATGDITFTPISTFTGIVSYQYEVCDNELPSANCATSVQEIAVLPTGSANSTLAADDFKSTVGAIPAIGNVLTNDTDPQGNLRTAVAQNISIPGVGTFVLATNGAYTFTPILGFTGAINFPYEICDNGTPSACAKATVYFLVTIANSTNAVNDQNNTFINTSVSGDVTTNDFDLEDNTQTFGSFLNNNNMVITTGSVVSGFNYFGNTVNTAGVLNFNTNGAYTFVPATDFTGKVRIPYNICDNGRPVACDTAFLEINVLPLAFDSNSVIATNDEYVTFGAPINGNLSLNDADPQGSDIAISGYLIDGNGDGTPSEFGFFGTPLVVGGVDINGNSVVNAGTITLNSNGTFVFEPRLGFLGQINLTYTLCDAENPLACSDASLVIKVLQIVNGMANNAPIAADDFSYTTINSPIVGDFFNNDFEPNGDPIRVNGEVIDVNGPDNIIQTIVTQGGGTLELRKDGSYTYSPAVNFVGPDFAIYEICDFTFIDPQPLCSRATIHLLVGPGATISGIVWNDVDGNLQLNGSEMVTNLGNTLFVNLVAANGIVLGSAQVLADGTYSINNAPFARDIELQLSINQGVFGSPPPLAILPTNWVNTGQDLNGVTNATSPGVIEVFVDQKEFNNFNFGIQERPTAGDGTPPTPITFNENEPGTVFLPLPFTAFAGNDVDGGNLIAIKLTQWPNDLDGIRYNDTTYYRIADSIPAACQTAVCRVFPVEGLIVYFNSALNDWNSPLLFDAATGALQIVFNYSVIDNAGFESLNQWQVIVEFNNAPLSVGCADFAGEANNGMVELSWKTSSETNNLGFRIERSNNGFNFQEVGFVDGMGNSSITTDYSFTDSNPMAGHNYYRLISVDQNQDESQACKVILVKVDEKSTSIQVFPNPSRGIVYLSKGLEVVNQIELMDANGKILINQVGDLKELNFQHLAEGIYYLRIRTENGVSTHKLIVIY